MPQIKCSDLSDKPCDFVAQGENAAETKNNYYAHGAEAEVHREMYNSATDEQKAAFGKKVDEYLAKQS